MRKIFDSHPIADIGEKPGAVESFGDRARFRAERGRAPSRETGGWDEPRASGRLPLIAAILAVALGAMALIGLREKIVRVAPPSSLYSALEARG